MKKEQNNSGQTTKFMESQEVRQFFLTSFSKSKERAWNLVTLRTYKEKIILDNLVELGLVSIEAGEFRTDVQGRIKSSEFICKLTSQGNDLIARLGANGDSYG